jgi:N-methylhydantoinase A/oxoprolinase/acetone carboxylase beta subunit
LHAPEVFICKTHTFIFMQDSGEKTLNKSGHSQDALVLGIDTGGTYTDGILMAYHTREILAYHKSLTTKRDFSIGIEAVIQGIHIEDPAAIQMVSVSTTLATNAIAEGKSKRVALLLIGYDPELIASFKMEARFATPIFYYFTGGHNLHGQEKAALDLQAILAKVGEIKTAVDAIAVSSYFSPLNPEHENRCFKAISSVCDLPVVLGHQLSTKLGSVERATTAALNASLLAVLKDFIIAVRRAMERRQINAPLMVVRGDGTLMSDEFATKTPVETIHSGPAASAIGGRFISRIDDALVVDIGGTTTDIALIEKGQVAVSEEGATVANYKTAVKAANLFSIALGGDSQIAAGRENKLMIGPERVVPLAYLADQYPRIREELKALAQRSSSRIIPDWLEYWFLLREPPGDTDVETQQEKSLVALLRNGPRPLPEILEHLNLFSKIQIGTGNLVQKEIIARAGLTPTDLLHVENRYHAWDRDAARLALEIFSRCMQSDPAALCKRVWRRMTLTIVHAILTFLSGKTLSLSDSSENGDIGQWFFYNSIDNGHPYLETRFRLRLPIIGIGAPAGIFLESVAEKLQTDLILPRHHQVANAVGAVAGSVMVAEEILVYPRVASDGLEVIGYYVQTSEDRQLFEEADEALGHAREISRERALGAALRSGADNPEVILSEQSDGLDTYRIRAKALGNPRLTR